MVKKDMAHNVIAEVLQKIKPPKEEQEQFRKGTSDFLQKLNSNLKGAKAILAGSGAKSTWLSGNHDIDIFVLFDYKEYSPKSPELSNILEPILKKSFPESKIARLHGSRDYFQLSYQNMDFEVIPILKINQAKQALNIMDISPLHAVWVNKHTKKLKDDILLAKQFCRAQGAYGAESYIGGFSGYVLEILIANYGSFSKLLQVSPKWKDKTVVDVEKYYKSSDMALFEINSSKLQSPLIVIDPVDKSRNAAAALSEEKLRLFQQKAREYLSHPASNFFEVKSWNIEKIKAQHGKDILVMFSVAPLEGKTDVVGGKLRKSFEFIQNELNQFGITESDWYWKEEENTAVFYFVLKNKELPESIIRTGPPLRLKEFVADFQKKNKDTFIKDNHLFARIKTPYPKLEGFIKNLLK